MSEVDGMRIIGWHIGRAFGGHEIEDECPCPKASCGLVISGEVHPDCPQHQANKTLRQIHDAEHCPARHSTQPLPAPSEGEET